MKTFECGRTSFCTLCSLCHEKTVNVNINCEMKQENMITMLKDYIKIKIFVFILKSAVIFFMIDMPNFLNKNKYFHFYIYIT